jgi:hypothetical protein
MIPQKGVCAGHLTSDVETVHPPQAFYNTVPGNIHL